MSEAATQSDVKSVFLAGMTPSEAIIKAIDIERDKTQAFFAEYALQARAPHAGDFFRQFVTDMLTRAKLAGLYTEIP